MERKKKPISVDVKSRVDYTACTTNQGLVWNVLLVASTEPLEVRKYSEVVPMFVLLSRLSFVQFTLRIRTSSTLGSATLFKWISAEDFDVIADQKSNLGMSSYIIFVYARSAVQAVMVCIRIPLFYAAHGKIREKAGPRPSQPTGCPPAYRHETARASPSPPPGPRRRRPPAAGR